MKKSAHSVNHTLIHDDPLFQPISQNEELRVWYAQHYAEALGEPLLSVRIKPEIKTQKQVVKATTGIILYMKFK